MIMYLKSASYYRQTMDLNWDSQIDVYKDDVI